jgi:hypothetical protein
VLCGSQQDHDFTALFYFTLTYLVLHSPCFLGGDAPELPGPLTQAMMWDGSAVSLSTL